jgi:hypothetical protein
MIFFVGRGSALESSTAAYSLRGVYDWHLRRPDGVFGISLQHTIYYRLHQILSLSLEWNLLLEL